jgi:hypothetical protein
LPHPNPSQTLTPLGDPHLLPGSAEHLAAPSPYAGAFFERGGDPRPEVLRSMLGTRLVLPESRSDARRRATHPGAQPAAASGESE